MTLLVHLLELLALWCLLSGVTSVAVCMWLRQHRNGYRLPYEQPCHVRLCPFDQDASS